MASLSRSDDSVRGPPENPSQEELRRSSEPGLSTPYPGVTRLVAAPPPAADFQDLSPEQLEFYVRASIHQDRTPGNLVVVIHPARRYKFPGFLPDALSEAGFRVKVLETQADRVRSVETIRDTLKDLSADPVPLDLLVVSGDGTLDNHVLVAAYWAFFPDLVRYRAGALATGPLDPVDFARIPEPYRTAFLEKLPDTATLDPDENTVKKVWLLRSELEPLLRRHKPVSRILKRTGRSREDAMLRFAILASYCPEKVMLRPHGFDLSGLAHASRERTFQGLYPFLRSIALYPAGTAADNAVFAGVPGWSYGLVAGLLRRFRVLSSLRRWLERRVSKRFLSFFLHNSVVVPERVSFVGLDGDWQRISSHAAGGPAAGHFFSADLTSKTRGLSGYLKRIPAVVVREGIFGSTIVRVRSRFSSGEEKSFTEARISEALYTNRTFIAGVGSVPTTNPTGFAGQSSLCMLPPIWSRKTNDPRILNFRGLLTLLEAISKGVLARLLHLSGLGVGTFAGGGKFRFLLPEHQVAIRDGESIDIEYLTRENRPRAIAVQVSGDPFQAYRMSLRIAWGPVPILGNRNSLLLAAIRRSLADLRLQQSYRLGHVYIGGVRYFRHHVGEDGSPEFTARTGLLTPPWHLPLSLPLAQRMLLDAWQARGTGEFVDTTESGLTELRRGRYAHNNDQSAHLLLVKEPRGTLLVRQVRARHEPAGEIYETRSTYHAVGNSYIVFRIQTLIWLKNEHPRILQEDHFFRNAKTFQQEAPGFFPVVARSDREPTLLPTGPGEEGPRDPSAEKSGKPDGLDPGEPGGTRDGSIP
jgi:hypothetical protein